MTFEDFCAALEPCQICAGTGVFMHPEFNEDGDEIPGAETPVECPACDGSCTSGLLDSTVALAAYEALVKAGSDFNRITAGVTAPKLRLVKS